jgi:hypothetical protein
LTLKSYDRVQIRALKSENTAGDNLAPKLNHSGSVADWTDTDVKKPAIIAAK